MLKDLPQVTNIRNEIKRQISTDFNVSNICEIILIPDLKKYE